MATKKITARNSGVAKRHDIYKINPLDVVIDYPENLREEGNYFDNDTEWEEFKNSIAEKGVLQPIELYVNQETSKFHVAHGFRRMTAVIELIKEGRKIDFIPFNEVADNQEERLIRHYILNNGRNLTPYEMAVGFMKLKAMGYGMSEISKKTSIDYNRVNYLVNFMENASHKLKESVRTGETSLHTARKIVEVSANQQEQNDNLESAREAATSEAETSKGGAKDKPVKVKANHLAKKKEAQSTFEKNLRAVLTAASKNQSLDHDSLSVMMGMVMLIEKGEFSPEDIAEAVFLKKVKLKDKGLSIWKMVNKELYAEAE
jgi:ParB-like chromosome segregation protein Spo0J